MRIGLNLLHARLEIGGAWNYIANILQAARLLGDEFEFVAYCTPASAALVPDDPRFTKKLVRVIGSSQPARILYEQTVLPLRALADGVQCLHWFANTGPLLPVIPSVVTIYDMMYLDHPENVASGESRTKKFYVRAMARHTSRHADVLAPMSDATAEVITRLFAPDQERIYVVRNPLDPGLRRAHPDKVAQFRQRFNLPSQFWLYVAHPYQHKNHLQLFEAYRKFRDAFGCQWPLVLRGDKEKGAPLLDSTVADLGIRDSVVWLPRLSPDEMTTLYSAATALVFPSLYEGGGIPVLEAMACGCPVLASDIAASRESSNGAAVFFNPASAEEIAAAMGRIFADPALRQECAAGGLEAAEQYSSSSVIAKLAAAYRKCAHAETRALGKQTEHVSKP